MTPEPRRPAGLVDAGAIVLRSGAPKPVAYGVPWATAAVILVGSVLLIA